MSNYLCIPSSAWQALTMSRCLYIPSPCNVQVLIYSQYLHSSKLIYSKHLKCPSNYIFPVLTFLKTYIFPITYIVPLQYQTCLPVLWEVLFPVCHCRVSCVTARHSKICSRVQLPPPPPPLASSSSSP